MWWLPLAIGTGIQVAGSLKAGQAAEASGKATQQSYNFQASQLARKAGQEIAASQVAAREETRKARLVASRALAVAAASGAGAADPTVVDLIADIEGEGAYRAALRLYQGKEEADSLQMQAQGALYSGQVARAGGRMEKDASKVNAISSLLSGASTYSLYSKYGQVGYNASLERALTR